MVHRRRDLKEAKALLEELTSTLDSGAVSDCLVEPGTN